MKRNNAEIVKEEYQVLDMKIEALNIFMDSDKYSTLPRTEQSLLAQQLNHMTSYQEILHERVELYNTDIHYSV